MFLYEIVETIFKWAWENKEKSFSLAALTSLMLLLIEKFGRKLITNQLKRLFHVKDKSEFAQYKANQIIIMENQRLMMRHMGVEEWVAPYSNGKQQLNVTGGRKNSLLQSLAVYAHALITGVRTRTKMALYHSKTRGESIPMKNYLKKLSRTKLQAFLLATIMNIALLVGYVMDVQDIQSKVESWMPMVNMAVQTVLTLIYVWVEGAIDKEQVKAQTEVKSNEEFETNTEHFE